MFFNYTCEKCPYSEFFLVHIFPHLGQKISEYEHFLSSMRFKYAETLH